MAAHIQMMETQDAMLSCCLGTCIAPRTNEDHLCELSNYATLLDNRCAKSQANWNTANNANTGNRYANNGNTTPQNGGHGNQGRGCGGSNGGGENGGYSGGHRNGGCGTTQGHGGPSFVGKECWNSMLWDERC